MLTAPPKAGDGVHNWLFSVARQLHAHLPAVEIIALLESKVQGCGRHVSRKEITDAVTSALACAWRPGTSAPVQSASNKWPVVDEKRREQVIGGGGSLCDLWEASRVLLDDNDSHTETIIDQLFPGNPLLCCGLSMSEFDTKPREAWRGEMSGLQLIVPSPMTAPKGWKKNPKPDEDPLSAHTLDNTGARRFLVCEFDRGTTDEQAALILHLGTFAPLVCALHSGGKSLHAWFFVEGHQDEKVLKFFRYAVCLGADSATWGRSQFVRMPDGTRDNGRKQTVFFLNFNVFKKWGEERKSRK